MKRHGYCSKKKGPAMGMVLAAMVAAAVPLSASGMQIFVKAVKTLTGPPSNSAQGNVEAEKTQKVESDINGGSDSENINQIVEYAPRLDLSGTAFGALR